MGLSGHQRPNRSQRGALRSVAAAAEPDRSDRQRIAAARIFFHSYPDRPALVPGHLDRGPPRTDRSSFPRLDPVRRLQRQGSRHNWPVEYATIGEDYERAVFARGRPSPRAASRPWVRHLITNDDRCALTNIGASLCHGLALGFWATSAERYGRGFWALTVSKANYWIRRVVPRRRTLFRVFGVPDLRASDGHLGVMPTCHTFTGSQPRRCLTDWRYSHSMASLSR